MVWNLPVRVSNAELYRNQQSFEIRMQASLKAIDDRITTGLSNTMKADVAQLIHDDMNRRISNLQADYDQASEHAWSTRSTVLVGLVCSGASSALTVLITLIVR